MISVGFQRANGKRKLKMATEYQSDADSSFSMESLKGNHFLLKNLLKEDISYSIEQITIHFEFLRFK